MTVTVVALLSINDAEPAALGEYFRITTPLLERAKAKIVKRFTLNEAIVGNRPAQMAVIVEYPDRAALDMVFESWEYRSAIPARDRAFLKYEVSIGVGDDAPQVAAEQAR
jgi:uncharacterized protein (DUF1330 family)